MVTGEAEQEVAVPVAVPPTRKVTVEPVSQVIVKSGVLSFVILSVFDEPESVAAVMSGVPGAAGATVSIVIERAPEATLWLPAVSVCLAVMLWEPSAKAPEVRVRGEAEHETEEPV